ncbi:MAG: hypothetical protein Q8P64_03100 [Deltaproteobacteria bacterium]|nr:hypothetical protein [Deltaproteobacteria bacterium]
MLRQACPLRARGSLSRRLSKPFILREPPRPDPARDGQDERFFPNVLSEVEGRAQRERLM